MKASCKAKHINTNRNISGLIPPLLSYSWLGIFLFSTISYHLFWSLIICVLGVGWNTFWLFKQSGRAKMLILGLLLSSIGILINLILMFWLPRYNAKALQGNSIAERLKVPN